VGSQTEPGGLGVEEEEEEEEEEWQEEEESPDQKMR